MAQLTRTVRFAAAHRYYRPDWSDAENRARFGACANEHGHGHNYELELTVRGAIDEETGFSVDLTALDAVLHEHVVVPLDHQHLNHAIAEFAAGGRIPTTENIARYLWARLSAALPPGVVAVRLRLREDRDLYVDYFGGGAAGGGA